MEAERAQPVTELRVLCVGRDFGNGIHIDRSTRLACGLVSDQQASHATADEHQFRQERTKPVSRSDELFKIRIAHWPSENGGEFPVRRISARAHARPGARPPKPGSRTAADGAVL